MDIIKKIAEELNLKPAHVKNVVEMIDEGNTIPFIARYRKEQTGEMTDVSLRDLDTRLNYLRSLEAKKDDVIRIIAEQGKLTEELEKQIQLADTLQRVDDLYRPFRPKRRTRATIAKEKNLEPLAKVLMLQSMNEKELFAYASEFIDEEKEVATIEEALNGAMDIIAEDIADDPDFRRSLKNFIFKNSLLITTAVDKEAESVYEMYYDFKEPLNKIANHRVLALNRAESEKIIKVSFYKEMENDTDIIKDKLLKNPATKSTEYIELAIEDGYKRLLYPSIEREIRNDLKDRAEDEAIKVFALNLKPLLMQSPIKGKNVIAIDPGFRTGCKVAVLDDTGKLLENTTIFPTEPRNKIEESKKTLKELIEKHNVELIAIGNGTGSRETVAVVADLFKEIEKNVSYAIVNEAGASIYSASEVGLKDFPNHDVTVRGAASIGRRLQDPLAELVKIDPKHIGVGQYQHDLNRAKLDGALSAVVEDSVNTVGVDLNTASPSLLKYVSGVSTKVADGIVSYREEMGKFNDRAELLKIKGLGPKAYKQCAGFLRISNGKNPLDNTGVHPESYKIAKNLLKIDFKNEDLSLLSKELEVGLPTLKDIVKELEKPGRDPREEMPKPILRDDILKMEDLQKDMVLNGTVRNVIDFGAFVDIGVKQDGLVHISELADKFVKHPNDVVKVGDIVKVRVLSIDIAKNRISLSMKNIQN
ncbi:MAG: Tex family protein [Gudongella sp.]|nr:Tex family protein [Gudongella sp.]